MYDAIEQDALFCNMLTENLGDTLNGECMPCG